MDNFTRVPNNIIDESKLNPYQFQLFTIIVRKTDGWCKVEDGISLSQFEKLVTFKKPKIVSTLKELIEFGFIEKKKRYNSETKQYSYSTYKISERVVTENNNPSNSELQGVVTEDYKQKKLNTKETNTSNKPSFKSTNERLYNEYMESKEVSVNEAKIILDYLSYRKDIGKQIKTITPLNSYWKVIVELHIKGYDIKACIEYMKEKEWMTLKEEYLKNSSIIPKQELQENQFIKDGVTYSEVVM